MATATSRQSTELDRVLADLNGPYDRAARKLVAEHGAFGDLCGDNTAMLEAVDRLLNDERRFIAEVQANASDFMKLEAIMIHRIGEVRDVAYLLGVAVGRRIVRTNVD